MRLIYVQRVEVLIQKDPLHQFYYFAKLKLLLLSQMAASELFHSVFLHPKDHGPGTLTRTINGHRLTETQGMHLRRSDTVEARQLHIQTREGEEFSVLFQQADGVDSIKFFSGGRFRKRVEHNGTYFEVGKPGVCARFNLEDGALLAKEVDLSDFPHLLIPAGIRMENVELIGDLCARLKEPRTPEPQGLVRISNLLDTILMSKEVIQTPPLFPLQPKLL